MTAWEAEAWHLIRTVLGSPAAGAQMWIFVAAAVVPLLLVMELAGSAVGAPEAGMVRRTLSLLLGLAVAGLVAVPVSLYLLPSIKGETLRLVLLIGLPILAVAAVAIPLMALILRSRYLETLISFSLALAASLIILWVVNAIAASMQGGQRGMKNIRSRTQSIDRTIRR